MKVPTRVRPAALRGERRRRRPACEALEGRTLLADFQLSGLVWPDPSRITYSIAPDQVDWGGRANVLGSSLDARLGAGWQREAARALQTWASVANLNIARVADSPLALDTWGLAQGDARFGDIRFGGYAFSSTTTLAQTYFPPPGSATISGDVQVNTAMNWAIGGAGFDFYSVMLHETGHSLGLEHSVTASPVMSGTYRGVRSGLTADDIAGIQALYGPRTADIYRASGLGASATTAIDVTPALQAGTYRGQLGGLGLTSIGDTTYFSVVAPAGSDGASFQVTAAAAGVSGLSPKVSVLDAALTPLAVQANPADWSNDVSARVDGVTAGARYYVAVTGATADVFAVGTYRLAFGFDGVTPPTPPPPPLPPPPPPPVPPPPPPPPPVPVPVPTPTPTPTPIPQPTVKPTAAPVQVAADRYEAKNRSIVRRVSLGRVAARSVGGLTLDTGADVDVFVFQSARAGVYQVAAAGARVQVFDGAGRLVTEGAGEASVRAARAGLKVVVQVSSADGGPLAGYTLRVSSTPNQVQKVRKASKQVVGVPTPLPPSMAWKPLFLRPETAGKPARRKI